MKRILRIAAASPRTGAWSSIILIRIAVGLIFILAGFRKFTEPAMGSQRFDELGFQAPIFWSGFVGTFELLGGLFVLIGLFTRAAALPLAITMVMAIWLTKLPDLGQEPLIRVLHSARLDFALLMLSLYLMIAGGGRFAVDRLLDRSR